MFYPPEISQVPILILYYAKAWEFTKFAKYKHNGDLIKHLTGLINLWEWILLFLILEIDIV